MSPKHPMTCIPTCPPRRCAVAPYLMALTFFVLVSLPGGLRAGTPGAAEDPLAVDLDGLHVALTIDPVDGDTVREGDHVRIRFALTDTFTGTPLTGAFPAAWMDRLPSRPQETPATCRQKVETFVGGSLLAPPEVDLNVYYVVAMNADATLTVVDPLFGFGTTKLLAMVVLDSPGEDWALTDDQTRLFVSQPAVGRLAMVDTASWTIDRQIDVGPGAGRALLQHDQHYLWVAVDGGVAVVDADQGTLVARIETGSGPHDLAVDHDDRHVFVSNRTAGTVSVIDVMTLGIVATVPAGEAPLHLDYSEAADAVYVVDHEGGVITVVDAERHGVRRIIEASPGLGRLRFAPSGRLAFVTQPNEDTIHIIDAASDRIVQTADVEHRPDQIVFSDQLAYVRHQGSETVLMVPLDQVGEAGRPVPVIDFPGGQAPLGAGAGGARADGIVQAPGATAVLVANPADRAIYYYKEGMAAPMGHFRNYGHEPRAVTVVDRSIREHGAGVYETVAQMGAAGRYEVAFFLDAPRTMHCFPVEVAVNEALRAAARENRVRVQPRLVTASPVAGRSVRLELRVTDAGDGAPRANLGDLQVLTFRTPGREQRRHRAEPLGDGRYRVDFVPDQPGVFYAFAQSGAANLAINEARPLTFRVLSDVQATETQVEGGAR